MVHEMDAHLALDYVATQDIKRGEELFMDYGEAWENAWHKHTLNWQSTKFWSNSYRNGRQWDLELRDLPVRTIYETLTDPYPKNIETRCHSILEEDDWTNFTWSIFEYGYPCEVQHRVKGDDDNHIYSVRLMTEPHNQYDNEFDGPETLVVNNVPRDAIRFFDIPRTTDIHLRGAFRHSIGLPDELMPKPWKNQVDKP